jgi:NAD(P)-dependent dehydrogenase (short-subunit alcohol dehydrogenase family)
VARRRAGTSVTVNALHPGFVRTSFFAGGGLLGWAARRVADVFAISPEQGARTSIHLATSPEVAGVTGQYFAKEKPATSTPQSHDRAAAQRLWQISEELTAISAHAKA